MDVKIKTDDLKFKFRVSAIAINEEKLLVNKYGEDSYCLPGGYVAIGETSEEAMIRELKEETGLDFKTTKFAGVIENFFTNIRNQKTHGIDFYYYVDLKEDSYDSLDMNYQESEETGGIKHEYSWIPLSDIYEYNILPNIIREDIKNNSDIFHHVLNK